MNTILFSDILLKTVHQNANFREKLEIASALDKINLDALELPAIDEPKVDTLFIKTAAALIKNAALVCNAGITESSIDLTWHAVSGAVHPVLQIGLPVSPVQIEYHLGIKPPKLSELALALVTKCRALCADVEFCALDATRAEKGFMFELLNAIIEAGATRITLCDASGALMADEAEELFKQAYIAVPALKNVIVGAELCNDLGMAGACAAAACKAGATVIKTVATGRAYPNLENLTHIVCSVAKLGKVNVKQTELHRICEKISEIIDLPRSNRSPFDFGVKEDEGSLSLDKTDDILLVKKAVNSLGYDLNNEDMNRIYEQFLRIANKKSVVTARELEAIIANAALQVPQCYRIVNYVVTSGNLISPTAVVKLEKDGQVLQGLSLGDGPVDAAILAIENAVGCHYELDDYQIQAVTEGREAMGSALVKLRANGKLYSGSGISTDVIGASIRAYISAVNKIVYEEE